MESSSRYSDETNLLPPSVTESDFDSMSGSHDSSIEYRLGVNIFMEGLNIAVAKPEPQQGVCSMSDNNGEPVILYERAMLPEPLEDKQKYLSGSVSVSNELLLEEADRPSMFRQNAEGKAVAPSSSDHYPKYTFDWRCVAPQHFYCGQAATFRIHIKPRENECTARVSPTIYLRAFNVVIDAHTAVRADDGFLVRPEADGCKTVATLGCTMDDGPFSKATDWTKNVTTQPMVNLPSSFKIVNIARRYVVCVKLHFHLVETNESSSHEYDIVIHPPQKINDGEGAVASSSGPIDPGDTVATLPQYEFPPDYDEVCK